MTAQTPDREYCANSTESGTAFRPGTVSGANTDATTVTTPMPTSSDGVNELTSNNVFAKSSSNSGTKNAYIVGGCAVAGVAAIAMFAVSRKKKNHRELSTPVEDPAMDRYDDTKTSKANNAFSPSTASYKNRLSERMTGESMLGDDSFQHNGSVPMPAPAHGRFIDQHKQQQQQKYQSQISSHGAPPSYAAVASSQHTIRPAPADSIMRDSSFFGSEFDERFTIDDHSVPERSSFESIVHEQGQNAINKANYESSFMSVTSNGFDSSFASLEDYEASHHGAAHRHLGGSIDSLTDSQYNGRNTSLSVESDCLTIYDRDTAASEFLRGSDESVMSSGSSSSLAFYADEGSPRSSIEF